MKKVVFAAVAASLIPLAAVPSAPAFADPPDWAFEIEPDRQSSA